MYGRSTALRGFCADHDTGYVLRVGCAFYIELAPRLKLRADEAIERYATDPDSWQIYAVTGSKGERRYRWAWLATASDRHFLLARKHLDTGELAYHYCYVPPHLPITLPTLVHVARLRWPVEEDFEFGKGQFGLDQTQVRLHTALLRHIVLTMAALAVCSVTAAEAETRSPAPILPTSPDEIPPDDPGLIALTVAEIKRLFILLTRQVHDRAHHWRWHFWRRRHQARARWFHHRARLRRQVPT